MSTDFARMDHAVADAPTADIADGPGAAAGAEARCATGRATATRPASGSCAVADLAAARARRWHRAAVYRGRPIVGGRGASVAIARLPLSQLFGALRGDGSPPLYYLLLHVWVQVFGTGDVAVRALSGVCAVAALPLIYRLAGDRAGPVTLALAAVNPWLIRYATETRMYALEVLLVLLGLLSLRAVKRIATPWRVALLAVVAGLLLLTHYWAFYLYAATALTLLVMWLRSSHAAVTLIRSIHAGLRPRRRARRPVYGWDEGSLRALRDEASRAPTDERQPGSGPASGSTPHIRQR